MDIENQEFIYCPQDGEYRVYCDICDKTFKLRYKKKHLNARQHKYLSHYIINRWCV